METALEFILLSPEQTVKNERVLLQELFDAGLELYHLRKPHSSFSEIRAYLATIPVELRNRVVLHSHFELANEFGVKGIHLNEGNKKLYDEFKDYKIISASFHSLSEVKENTFSYEYVFLSPIFDSISKVGYKSKFDLNLLERELTALKGQKQLPKIIALGGIDAGNVAQVQQAGFAGAALLGAVWQNENPVQSFLEIQSAVKDWS